MLKKIFKIICKKSIFLPLLLIILSVIIGIYFFPRLPEQMASHWNLQGEVDNYSSKFWATFLMPIISIILLPLFILLPEIDPLKENVEKFKKYFEYFIVLIFLLLFYLDLLVISWNLHLRFSMNQLISPAFGILFYFVTILLEKSERNWFIGIKTPWTLSEDIVWQKTHRRGSLLFKISSILAFLGIIFPPSAFFFVLGPVILTAFYTTIYSYLEYKNQLRLKKLNS